MRAHHHHGRRRISGRRRRQFFRARCRPRRASRSARARVRSTSTRSMLRRRSHQSSVFVRAFVRASPRKRSAERQRARTILVAATGGVDDAVGASITSSSVGLAMSNANGVSGPLMGAGGRAVCAAAIAAVTSADDAGGDFRIRATDRFAPSTRCVHFPEPSGASARASSPASSNRSSGSLLSVRMMIADSASGMSRRSDASGVGVFSRIAAKISLGLSPSNGSSFVSSSYIITPSDQRSARASTFLLLRSCSGDRARTH